MFCVFSFRGVKTELVVCKEKKLQKFTKKIRFLLLLLLLLLILTQNGFQ